MALGKGLHIRRLHLRNAAAIALSFAVFQAVMPVVGVILILIGTRILIDHLTGGGSPPGWYVEIAAGFSRRPSSVVYGSLPTPR